MYNQDTDLLFPSRAIRDLVDLRGDDWKKLIIKIKDLPEDHPDHLAFILLMVELNNCATCNSDSFRAMRGCTACSQQTIRRFRENDQELLDEFEKAQKKIKIFQEE